MSKAKVTQIQVGYKSFDGLLKDGQFGVGVPQISKLFPNSIPPNRSAKQIERLLGMTLRFEQWATELNPKAVNVLLLPDFEKLLRTLDRKGDKDAQDFVNALLGFPIESKEEKNKEEKKKKQKRKRKADRRKVYLIGSKGREEVKIGISVNPEERLRGLQTSYPYKLEILACISGGKSKEQELHTKFKSYCLRGEWFKLTPEISKEFGIKHQEH